MHLDVAGTAWAEDAKPYQPKGATGAMDYRGAGVDIEAASDAETAPTAGDALRLLYRLVGGTPR